MCKLFIHQINGGGATGNWTHSHSHKVFMAFQKTSRYCNYFSVKNVAFSEERKKLLECLMGNCSRCIDTGRNLFLFNQHMSINLTDRFFPCHTFREVLNTLFYSLLIFSLSFLRNTVRYLLLKLIIQHLFRYTRSHPLLGLSLWMLTNIFVMFFNLIQIHLQCMFCLQWNLVKPNILEPHHSSDERKFILVQHSSCLFKYIFSYLLMTSKHMR